MIPGTLKQQAGKPFVASASALNAATDAANRLQLETVSKPSGGDAQNIVSPSCTILVRNTTGETLNPGSILSPSLGLGTFPTKPMEVRKRPVLTGIAPVNKRSIVLILEDAIRANEIGRAACMGATVCTVDITDAAHNYAKPGTSTAKLTSCVRGPVRIMARDTTGGATGDKLCIVLLQSWFTEITNDTEVVAELGECVDGDQSVTPATITEIDLEGVE